MENRKVPHSEYTLPSHKTLEPDQITESLYRLVDMHINALKSMIADGELPIDQINKIEIVTVLKK